MRRFCLSFILFFAFSSSTALAADERSVVRLSEVPATTTSEEIPQTIIDESLAALILGDDTLCCRVSRVDPRIGELVWGPLYWRRLKILCPRIRPTAIC